MSNWSDSIRTTGSPPPGPPTDFLPPGPPTLGPPSPPAGNWPVSPSVPGYELLGELGRGGMGVVYKARHRSLNRVVALKVLIGGALAGPVEKARFRLEAEAVARLDHPNIVQVFDIGEHGGAEYIAFEFVDGPTIRRWQAGRCVEPALAAQLAAAVARGVQHAHDNGIIHRDLKPANILLAEDRGQRTEDRENRNSGSSELSSVLCPLSSLTPKVTDFGLAKSLEGDSGLTQSGMACGTPNYMSPEQVRGGAVGSRPAVDVWGIGAVLFELLTGRAPFTGTDAASIMQDILLCEPPAVRKFVPRVPRDLGVIVAKCLERNPAHRYLSAAAVADDLDRFLTGRQILARPVGRVVRAARWVGRNPLVAALGLALAGGLAGTSAFAVALLQSAERERAALAEEARQRQHADRETRAAEAARDDTRTALTRVTDALATARAEKERAEGNLATARQAVEQILEVIDRHQADDPAVYSVYRELLVGVEPFLQRFLDQKAGDRKLRADQAEVARKLGTLESAFGRPREARAYFLRSVEVLRELAAERPGEREHRLPLGSALAMAGAVSVDLGESDAEGLFTEGLAVLEGHTASHPADPAGWNALVHARLAVSNTQRDPLSDDYDLAVLESVARLQGLAGPTPFTVRTRAHALNNVASGLTNRGKTEEAEAHWLEVVGLREALARAAGGEAADRFELGKALANYANQLSRTDRPEQESSTRERAAAVFDALRHESRIRVDYIDVIVQNDHNLATAYAQRNDAARAIERLDRAIELNATRVGRESPPADARGTHADMHTRRAELHAAAARHGDAARDFRAAIRFSTRQAHAEYCTGRLLGALARAGDRAEAAALAARLDLKSFSHPYPCVEVARGWVLLARAAEGDATLTPAGRRKAADAAIAGARDAIRWAARKGMFADPDRVRWFHAEKDFEPIWDVFPREEK